MKPVYLLLLLLLPFLSLAQLQIERTVISSSGMSKSDGLVVDGTLGETNELTLSIGFHQMTPMMTAVSVSKIENLNIYPNPTIGMLNLEGENLPSLIEIFDGHGLLVKRYQRHEIIRKIDLSNFNAGLYYLKLMDEKGIFMGSVAIIKME